jgi:hypothetical protein
MAKNYSDCLAILTDNNIIIDRWFTIDNILYFSFLNQLTEKEIEKITSLFIEADYFKSFKQFAIDLNKQPFTSPLDEKKIFRTYSKAEIQEKKKQISEDLKQSGELFSL